MIRPWVILLATAFWAWGGLTAQAEPQPAQIRVKGAPSRTLCLINGSEVDCPRQADGWLLIETSPLSVARVVDIHLTLLHPPLDPPDARGATEEAATNYAGWSMGNFAFYAVGGSVIEVHFDQRQYIHPYPSRNSGVADEVIFELEELPANTIVLINNEDLPFTSVADGTGKIRRQYRLGVDPRNKLNSWSVYIEFIQEGRVRRGRRVFYAPGNAKVFSTHRRFFQSLPVTLGEMLEETRGEDQGRTQTLEVVDSPGVAELFVIQPLAIQASTQSNIAGERRTSLRYRVPSTPGALTEFSLSLERGPAGFAQPPVLAKLLMQSGRSVRVRADSLLQEGLGVTPELYVPGGVSLEPSDVLLPREEVEALAKDMREVPYFPTQGPQLSYSMDLTEAEIADFRAQITQTADWHAVCEVDSKNCRYTYTGTDEKWIGAVVLSVTENEGENSLLFRFEKRPNFPLNSPESTF